MLQTSIHRPTVSQLTPINLRYSAGDRLTGHGVYCETSCV